MTEYKDIDISEFDFSKIEYGSMKENQYGGRFVDIKYDGGKVPIVKFPKMTCPFGMGIQTNEKSGEKSYSLSLSFDNLNKSSELMPVYKKCLELDEKIKRDSIEKFDEWLECDDKKEATIFVKKQYKPIVKHPGIDKLTKKRKNYSATRRVNVRVDEKTNLFRFRLFNKNNKKVIIGVNNYEELISPRDDFKTACIPSQIWFSPFGFGISWTLTQAKIFKGKNFNDKCMFDSDNEDDNNEDEDDNELSEKESKDEKVNNKENDDSSDDDVSDDE